MIEEKDVNVAALSDVFRAAFMDVQSVDDNSFTVKGINFPFHLRMSIEPEHKLISFTDVNRIYRISVGDALTLCNVGNKSLGPARFFLVQNETALLAITQYQMTFEKGVLPIHIVTNFRAFEQCAGSAVRELFKDYIRP